MKRRKVLQAAVAAGASSLAPAISAGETGPAGSVYARLGVKPLIYGMGTVTVVGGSLMPPEVVRAMEEASRHFVLDEMLAQPGLDMVSVCTPHPSHPDLTEACAHAGKHVLVEKPMAVDLRGCDRMMGAADAAGVKLGVVSQRRFYEPVLRVRQSILDGKIGVPVLGTVTVLGWRDEAYYRSDPWRGKWATEGGGVMLTQTTHQIDLFQWLMGAIDELFGYWGNLNHPYIEVEDTAIAVVRFRSGGPALERIGSLYQRTGQLDKSVQAYERLASLPRP